MSSEYLTPIDKTSAHKIVTDSLGFHLEVDIFVGDFEKLGRHVCFENAETGVVDAGSPHAIKIRAGCDDDSVCLGAAHEAYHLFESIRHLATVDEEARAEVFGELVRRIFTLARTSTAANEI